ncbi:hypothetical protein [Lysobacter sp. CA199]|uniref:hypothetical protein n=1 Tax=Lysobacter sp. CA199 TaxID=3455608 RepID=UPI003F8CFFE8
MRLPDTLKPWRAWLDWFDPELAGAVGDLLLRLHPMLGAFRMRAQSGQVEPEGIDDLRRRGSYDRLLLSEWALADAAPDEFDRRAAGGEHLFLNPKLVAREVDALTVAVFDSGPAQLGAARLAHVALWILLAQRAQAAKARFAWGVLGRPGEVHDADSPQMLKRLLSARTLTPGGALAAKDAADDAQELPRKRFEREWAEHLDALAPVCGERWSIGAAEPGLGLGHRVSIRRDDPGALDIAIAARQARRDIRLALPEPSLSARLLGGHFEALERVQGAPVGGGKLSLKQPPLISFDGRSVAVPLLGDTAVIVYRLPRDGQAPCAPKVSRWSKSKWMLAATLIDRHFCGVMPGESSLELWQMSDFNPRSTRAGTPPLPPPEELDTVPGRARWLPCALIRGGHSGSRLFVLSGSGHLLSWTRMAQGIDYSVVARGVSAIGYHDQGGIVYLAYSEHNLSVVEYRGGVFKQVDREAVAEPPRKALLCGRRRNGLLRLGYALEQPVGGQGGERSSVWRVFSRERDRSSDYETMLPADWKVEGLALAPTTGVHLIALRPDRRALVSIGAAGRTTLYESAYAITAVTVAADCDVVALIDQQGRLVVLRDQGRSVLVYTGGGDG